MDFKGHEDKGYHEVHQMLGLHLKKLSMVCNELWTKNAFAHVVWKLSGFLRFLVDTNITDAIKKYLLIENIFFHVLKKYDKEFTRGKQSFF